MDNGISSLDGVGRRGRRASPRLSPITTWRAHAARADVIVNPNQPGCAFPSKNLAGVGVIFYVMLALRLSCGCGLVRAAGRAEPRPLH